MKVEVLIVGGGLSGLHTAYELHKRGISFLLVESRDRLGGRILSCNAGNSQHNNSQYNFGQVAFDLGPSWFWPGQSYMQSLIDELGLADEVFMQAGTGDALYEDNQGNMQRGIAGISMAGAYRMKGGIRQIIAYLSKKIPSELLLTNAAATEIEYQQEKIVSTILVDGMSTEVTSKSLVLALPPRVAIASIKFNPEFTQTRLDELNAIATWMAGHAKFVAIYKNRFWSEAGFSGDVISHRGPLQEIHDASSDSGELSALFGFVSIQAQHRKERDDEIRAMSIAQLTRLFGESASEPIEVHIKDWAFDIYTSTSYDQEMLKFHPANDIVNARENSWDQKLIWSGTESADHRQHANGFLEGALEASSRTITYLTS
jgi:monoamine oxidase